MKESKSKGEHVAVYNEILQLFISGLFSLAGAGLGVITTSKLTNYRLEQLEQRMNQYEKMQKED